MSTKTQTIEWRRDRVLELSSQGFNQSDIATVLQIDKSIISRDMAYLRQQAQEHLKTHIQDRMPEEYHRVEVSIKQVLMKAWEIVDNTTDERIRLQALSLIRECDSSRLEMITNGTVVSDVLKYVNGKAEKLKHSLSNAALEEEEDYQTTVTEEIEPEATTNYSSSNS